MKKEILFAVILGLTMGLIITYGIYRAQLADTGNQANTLEASPEISPDIKSLSDLVINAPEHESITDQDTATITGNTTAGSFVVIFVGEEEFITTADSAGNFSITATLEEGSNVIGVHSIDEDGNETVQEVMVVYTQESLLDELNAVENGNNAETSSTETTDNEDEIEG